MDDHHPPTRPRSPALIRVLLLASLGLNLFFAGWLFGARVVPWRDGPPRGPMHQLSEHLRRTLSDEGFKAVTRLVHDLEARRRQQFDVTEPLRERVRQALTAEPFDRDGFARTLSDLDADISRQRAQLDGAIVDTIASLTPEDRRRLAELPLPPPPPPPAAGFAPNFLPIDRPPRP